MANSTSTDHDLPGYALLIAAEPPVRHPLAVTAQLPPLAALPPARLVGTRQASAVQLANPDDPQTVLTCLRTAAAAEGHLLVYAAGHLVVDTRQHRLHLALARTTARTVRYTALPWHWLAAELRHRPPGSTTVVADLAADAGVWQALVSREQALDGPYALYGAVQLEDRRHRPTPAYTRAFAHILRTVSATPPAHVLHEEAVGAAVPDVDAAATLWLGGVAPAPPAERHPVGVPVGVPEPRTAPGAPTAALVSAAPAPPTAALSLADPHRAISEASQAGRHAEAAAVAAACEQNALRGHGATSPEVAHWIEVRAFLAFAEGAVDRACELWMRGAVTRLMAEQPESHPAVAEAVDRAHHAWHRVTEPGRVRELGTELLSLRTRVPGKDGAREDVRQRLAKLAEALSH
ncbi:hypothetical protein [Streptomyces spectabilis]|uniref:Uncharacterized protein n=1 Tax=Streptomyces spectabilis TaxID=68270 RepID=A0A5P2XH46_STRST|nr:hypothetical protein [Streptomyces spectabilis]MBB5102524.1 hypothetical protein [Streptomyces spectabilis]MCI3907564.1 hypothetical protein [Streptomyces spectabilis]QEV64253.1 hypothetical protein CP982_40820 [Streptomyces spectabilis]